MKVRVCNYQSVKDISLDIDGFTVLVGKSNSGKTALLRAISGSFYNDSVRGKVRMGESSTKVEVVTDSISWEWEKGDNKNDYTITVDGEVEEASRVGRNVPDKIQDAGYREIKVDDVKIRPQIAFWHDPIFLLNDKGKVVTELISAATRLDVLNLAQRRGAQELRKIKSVRNVRQDDLVKATQHLDTFSPLDAIKVEDIETLHATQENLTRQLAKVSQLLERLSKVDAELERLSSLEELPGLPESAPRAVYAQYRKVTDYGIRTDKVIADLSALSTLAQVPALPESAPTKLRDTVQFVSTSLTKLETTTLQLSAVTETLSRVHLGQIPDVQNLYSSLREVARLTTSLRGRESQLRQVSVTLDRLPPLGSVSLQETHQTLTGVKSYEHRLRQVEAREESLTHALSRIDLEGLPDPRSTQNRLDAVVTLTSRLAKLKKHVSAFRQEWAESQTLLEEITTQREDLLQGAGVCPICNTPMQANT
tara:strand:+ start:4757 stop:6196 length:1440 start_codon:yes stop_codon:yes gene_type:complete